MNKRQLDAIEQFVAFSGGKEKHARLYLSATNYNVEQAVSNFFDHPPDDDESEQDEFNPAKVTSFYEQYRDDQEDVIGATGIEKLAKDLKIDPNGIDLMILAFKMDAATSGEFKRAEFSRAMTELRIDNLQTLRERLPSIRDNCLQNDLQFKAFYNYCFKLGLLENAKVMTNEVACELWSLLLKGRFALLDDWLEFVKNQHKKAIPKDVWNQLLEFAKNVKPDLSNYDADSSWPTLFDTFVQFKKQAIKN